MNKLFALSVLLLLFSCRSARERETARFFEEWMYKEIEFPEDMVFTVQGDTVGFDFMKSDYKLVTSIKNKECLSCNLRLNQWNNTINEINLKTGRNIPVLFFLHPNSYDELVDILKRDNFRHPVCIDMRNEFDSMNNITIDELSFKSFLIDKENKVVGIGNPVVTPAIKGLYISLINGTDYKDASKRPTSLTISRNEIDLGELAANEVKTEHLWIKNTGDDPLVITGYNSSCGCTELVYNDKPLMKGDSVCVIVKYTPDAPGYFRKFVTISCNVSQPPTISVYGSVKE